MEQIPPGRVCSYGQVARLAGYPHHARQITQALQNAPAERALPWHRVVGAHGWIRTPPQSELRAEQVSRLQAEGIPIENDRVAPDFFWHQDQDALPWGFVVCEQDVVDR